MIDSICMRTINDCRDLVIDGFYSVIDAGYPIVDTNNLIRDSFYSIIDVMRGLQDLGSGNAIPEAGA
jgi:hypothetical protein